VQREASLAAAAGLDPTAVADDDDVTPPAETVSPGVAQAAAAAAEAATAAAVAAAELQQAQALERAAEAPVDEGNRDAAASAPVKPAPVPTQSIPVVDLAQLEVEELGLADRLGLGETDPDDEVGPTS
jgi:cell division transport system ATP-binding protein